MSITLIALETLLERERVFLERALEEERQATQRRIDREEAVALIERVIREETTAEDLRESGSGKPEGP